MHLHLQMIEMILILLSPKYAKVYGKNYCLCLNIILCIYPPNLD